MSNHKLEMTLPSDTEVLMTRTFDAPRELVWEYFTDPEKIMQWEGGPGTVLTKCECDFRVGGKFLLVFSMEGHGEFPFSGEFLEVNPKTHFVRTFLYDLPHGGTLPCTEYWEFAEEDGKTTFHLLTKHQTKESRDVMVDSGIDQGFAASLCKLDDLLAAAMD